MLSLKQIIGLTALIIIAQTTENVVAPLWIESMGQYQDAYFILLQTGYVYPVLFLVTAIIVSWKIGNKCSVKQPPFWYSWNVTKRCIWLGFTNSLNGLFVLYASLMQRTPPLLQSILAITSIYTAVIASYFFLNVNRNYCSGRPLIALFLITSGVIISLLPTIINEQDSSRVYHVIWPIFFAIGFAFASLYSVLQERHLRKTREEEGERGYLVKLNMLLWQTTFNGLWIIFLFWTDFIPNFGFLTSVDDLGSHANAGLTCSTVGLFLGGDCINIFWYALAFNLAYYVAFNSSSYLNEEDATYTMITSVLVPVFATVFWIVKSDLNTNKVNTPLWSIFLSLVLCVFGMIIWKRWTRAIDASNTAQAQVQLPLLVGQP